MNRLAVTALVVAMGVVVGCADDEAASQEDAAVALDGALDAGFSEFDAASNDSGLDAGVVVTEAFGDVVYKPGDLQSPINEDVVQRWKQIVAVGADTQANVFAKVGDSITASENYFLGCFTSQARDLGEHTALASTVDYFAMGDAAGSNPFERDSVTAVGGWTAAKAVEGDPSPLEREVTAINPRFAVVMYGTNDAGYGDDYLFTYADNMWTLLDGLIGRGVLPILSTIPPRTDASAPGGRVPRFNAVIRGFAQTRGLPLVDYFGAMAPLPAQGLAGDGVHPTAFAEGTVKPCVLSEAALSKGYNMRNKVTLEALDRVRRAVLEDEAFDDPTERSLSAGVGTADDPYAIASLPFAHATTTVGGQRLLDMYDGCGAAQDESGPEIVYRIEVEQEMDLSIYLADRGNTDVDLHLLRGSVTTPACEARAHQRLDHTLDPGTWYIVVDSFVSGGGETRAGEYLLVVSE